MSIQPPRYSAGPVRLRGRPGRLFAIFAHEVRERFGVAMVTLLVLGFLVLTIILVFDVELGTRPPITLAAFADPYASVVWPLLVLLVVTAAGAPSVASDLGSRSITLYLSRPILLRDYLLAKSAGIGVWIALVAIGPVAVGSVLLAALGVVSAELALSAIGVAVGLGLLAAVFFVGLALLLSSITSKSLYAGVAIFGTTLSLEIAAGAISGATGNAQVRYLGPFTDLESVMGAAFQTGLPTPTVPAISAAGLVLVGVGLAALAWMRLRRVEVIGE